MNGRASTASRRRRRADRLLAEIESGPARRVREAAQDDPRFHSAPVVLRLLDRAYAAADTDPHRAGQLAGLALRLTQTLEPAAAPPDVRRDLEARAWLLSAYASGRRGLLNAAAHAFRAAEELIAGAATADAGLFCRLLGSLRRREGRRLEALALLERAARVLEEAGEPVEAGVALNEVAAMHLAAGEPEASVSALSKALSLTEPWWPPAQMARQRLALAVAEAISGRRQVAEELLGEALRENAAAGAELPALGFLAGARVALANDDRAASERLLEEAWYAALAARAVPEALTAAIQRAALYAAGGRAEACSRLAGDLEALLDARQQLPPLLKTEVRELQQALRSGQADLARLDALQGRFRRRLRDARQPPDALAALLDQPLALLFSAPDVASHSAPDTPPGAGTPDGGDPS